MESNRIIKLAGIPELGCSPRTPPRVIDVRPGAKRSRPETTRPEPLRSWARQHPPQAKPRPQPQPQPRLQPQPRFQTQPQPQPRLQPQSSPQPPPAQQQALIEDIHRDLKNITKLLMYHIQNSPRSTPQPPQAPPVPAPAPAYHPPTISSVATSTSLEEDSLADISMSSKAYMKKHGLI
ncbi:hypothetical protein TB1_010172 [Malus domestica]